MDKKKKTVPYKITSPTERKEVEWMIKQGMFKSINDLEEAMTRVQERRAAAKRKKAT